MTMAASTTRTGAPRHVVVVGGSIAGLLAARALVDHVDRVTVLDRDDLPREPAARGGVPQGRHAHGLLDRDATCSRDGSRADRRPGRAGGTAR